MKQSIFISDRCTNPTRGRGAEPGRGQRDIVTFDPAMDHPGIGESEQSSFVFLFHEAGRSDRDMGWMWNNLTRAPRGALARWGLASSQEIRDRRRGNGFRLRAGAGWASGGISAFIFLFEWILVLGTHLPEASVLSLGRVCPAGVPASLGWPVCPVCPFLEVSK